MSSILAALAVLDADALVHVPSVVVAEASLSGLAAVVILLACLLSVIFRDATIILPGIANILKAGVVSSQDIAVTVINTGCERDLADLVHGFRSVMALGKHCRDRQQHTESTGQPHGGGGEDLRFNLGLVLEDSTGWKTTC